MSSDTVLVGTFVGANKKPGRFAKDIIEHFGVNRIFIFEAEEDDKKRYLLTFNIAREDKESKLKEFKERFKNTIQLHRNKDYNTLYTINSLNAVVESQNGGVKDEKFQVDWSPYENSCLVLNSEDKSLKVIKTELIDEIRV